MRTRPAPGPFTLFVAIVSLCLALICYSLSIVIPIPRIFFPISPGWIGFLLLLFPAHVGEKYFRSYRLRRRIALARQRGLILCQTCGYDLRESKSTCPECGTTTVQQTSSAA